MDVMLELVVVFELGISFMVLLVVLLTFEELTGAVAAVLRFRLLLIVLLRSGFPLLVAIFKDEDDAAALLPPKLVAVAFCAA